MGRRRIARHQGPGQYREAELPVASKSDESTGGASTWDEQQRAEWAAWTEATDPRPADNTPPPAAPPVTPEHVPSHKPADTPESTSRNLLSALLDAGRVIFDLGHAAPSPPADPLADVARLAERPEAQPVPPVETAEDRTVPPPEARPLRLVGGPGSRTGRPPKCLVCVENEALQGVYCSSCNPKSAREEEPPHLQSSATTSVVIEGRQNRFLESRTARARDGDWVAASAATERSTVTAVLADLGEDYGYKWALTSGEVGVLAPSGANRRGVDFVSGVFDPSVVTRSC